MHFRAGKPLRTRAHPSSLTHPLSGSWLSYLGAEPLGENKDIFDEMRGELPPISAYEPDQPRNGRSYTNGHDKAASPLPPLDGLVPHLTWPDETPPVREWIIEGIVPTSTVTLLQGDGGLGKSLLTLQMLYACATGREWLGQKTKRCRVMGFYCEDDDLEIRRRMWSIVNHYCDRPNGPGPDDDNPFQELEDMLIYSRVGMDSLLMEFDQAEGGRGKVTDILRQAERAAVDHGAELIILDSLHDLFGGNENNRVQVRQFVNALQRIATDYKCAIILNGHPSKSGLQAGDGSSGSTAWNNSVRSRLYLAKEKAHPDEKPPHTGPLMLRIMKANYAAVGTHIELSWTSGVLLPVNLTSTPSTRDRKDLLRRVFLDCLEEAWKQNRPPQYAPNGKYPAPKMFAAMPMAQGFKAPDFKSIMEHLINDRVIEIATHKDASRNSISVIQLKQTRPSHWDDVRDE